MTTELVDGITADDLEWCDLRDENETVQGRVGIAKGLTHGTPMYADGWATSWCTPILDLKGRTGMAPMPLVILEVPDYRRSDAVSLLFDPITARNIAAELIRLANESERSMSQIAKRAMRELKDPEVERARQKRIHAATRCSIEGCTRERKFFNDSGEGFCKKHAEAAGVRPKGKII